MGLLRLLLAFSVFHVHSGGLAAFRLVPADTAVHCFYIISGFYMALVLNEKYLAENSTYWTFIGNRLLRLMPGYLFVVLATVLISIMLAAGDRAPLEHAANLWAVLAYGDVLVSKLVLLATQATMLLQDIFLFMSSDPEGHFHFTTDYKLVAEPAYRLMLVPQAWSLSLELYFYLLAPFLLRLSVARIALVMAASLLLRVAMIWAFDLRTDPWSYRFFPTELAFFLAGAIAYRLHRQYAAAAALWTVMPLVLLGAILGSVDFGGFWHAGIGVASWLRIPFITVVLAALPYAFSATRNLAFDRVLGELSYPLYIGHVLVIWTFTAFDIGQSGWTGRSLLIASALAVALFIVEFVEKPFQRIRAARAQLTAASRSQIAAA